jgi:hypothetical protein
LKVLFSALLLFATISSFGQNEQEYGDSLFTFFSSDNQQWEDWFISLETYHKLIARQRMPKDDQDDFMLSVNESYPEQLENFVAQMKEMQSQYNLESDDVNYYTLDRVSTKPLEDVKLVYFFRLNVTYHYKKGKDSYVIEFQACYLNKEWHMMEPFQEYYE